MPTLEPISANLTAFLHGETDGRTFRHADHVGIAYELLTRHDFPEAAWRCASALKTIAARSGAPGAYHETITLAFLALIGERRAARSYPDFAGFIAANPDLLDKSALRRWYSSERLGSATARATFVLPDARP
jgi:hypothetical protein